MNETCTRCSKLRYIKLSNMTNSWVIECPSYKRHSKGKKLKIKQEKIHQRTYGFKMFKCNSHRRKLMVA